jgi:cation transport regulator
MPYATNAELPAPVRAHLPRHAQDIYRAAFNSAYEHYGPAHEGVAHRIAWAAVKKSYIQRTAGIWVRRSHRPS